MHISYECEPGQIFKQSTGYTEPTCRNSAELINYQCIRSRFSCCCCGCGRFVFLFVFCFVRLVVVHFVISRSFSDILLFSDRILHLWCLLSSLVCTRCAAKCAPVSTYYVFTILHSKKKCCRFFESEQKN